MARVTVLGGCGAVGSRAVKTLVQHPEFSEVVIADYNIVKAESLKAELSSPKVKVQQFDAHDRKSIHHAISGSDVVLNCVGPFYSTVKPILETTIDGFPAKTLSKNA